MASNSSSFHRLLVFDKEHHCLLDHHWGSATPSAFWNEQETRQLLMGVCYSMKVMLLRMDGTSSKETHSNGWSFSFETNTYNTHYYESVTGWRFIFQSTAINKDLSSALSELYAKVFVPTVINGPLFSSTAMQDSTTLAPSGFPRLVVDFFQRRQVE